MFWTVTEIFLSTILTTSIAGAGLMIAIYTLIAQLRNRIFENRLATVRNKKAEFDKTKDSITPEESFAGTRHLQTLGEEIQSRNTFPTYLASWVKFVFTGYIVTAFFSFGWLTNPVQNPQAEFLLQVLFCLSTFGFFVVVWNAIKDIHELMKEEFEQLKKEQQEMEKTRKEIEEFKRKIRDPKSEK